MTAVREQHPRAQGLRRANETDVMVGFELTTDGIQRNKRADRCHESRDRLRPAAGRRQARRQARRQSSTLRAGCLTGHRDSPTTIARARVASLPPDPMEEPGRGMMGQRRPGGPADPLSPVHGWSAGSRRGWREPPGFPRELETLQKCEKRVRFAWYRGRRGLVAGGGSRLAFLPSPHPWKVGHRHYREYPHILAGCDPCGESRPAFLPSPHSW